MKNEGIEIIEQMFEASAHLSFSRFEPFLNIEKGVSYRADILEDFQPKHITVKIEGKNYKYLFSLNELPNIINKIAWASKDKISDPIHKKCKLNSEGYRPMAKVSNTVDEFIDIRQFDYLRENISDEFLKFVNRQIWVFKNGKKAGKKAGEDWHELIYKFGKIWRDKQLVYDTKDVMTFLRKQREKARKIKLGHYEHLDPSFIDFLNAYNLEK